MNTNNTFSRQKLSPGSPDFSSCQHLWRKLLHVLCLGAAILLMGVPSAAQALSKLPFYEDYRYTNSASLKGVNGWDVFSNAPPYGVQDPRYHGWQGVPGGKATVSNEQGRVAGVALLRQFSDYTGLPGVGWPTTSGKYDKATLVTMSFDYEPTTGYVHQPEPTVWSKYGRMYSATRWNNESRGSYYMMMPVVRWFVKKNGLISAYNGNRIKHLTHEPITNRTTLVVTADYEARKWSLWLGTQQIVTNFSLHATHAGATMNHNGWYKDYDGLKEVGLIDATTNSASLFDQVRIYEGTRTNSAMPFMETFETRTLGAQTITLTNGPLHGQDKWYATNATISASAQSTAPYSVGAQGVSLSSNGECLQYFLDNQTDVWTDLWLKPLVSGSGSTTVDAGGQDAVFRVDSDGAVVAYNGVTPSVITTVVVTAWSRFTVHSDYNTGTWGLQVDGNVVATGLAFKQAVPSDTYREVRVSVSGTAVAYLDDVSISTTSPFDLPTVSFDTDTLSVGENAVNVTVTARLNHSVLQSVSVGYVLNAGGIALPVNDFNAANGTLVFAPGETVKTFSFTVVNDTDNEENETLSFTLTNIVNATAGTYPTLTYTLTADPADFSNIPFEEPFEYRTLGDLQGQNGWLATYTTVQTNDTYGGSQKAGQGVRIASELTHAFSNGAHRVVTEWRAKPVFAQHAPIVPSQASYAFYVSTNGHIIAFDGPTATDLGGGVVLAEGAWAHFRVVTDHDTHTWSLAVNNSPLAQDLGFYATSTTSYSLFGVAGPVTIDDIRIDYNVPLAPTGLVAEALDAQVLLDWQAAQGSTAYVVKRSTVQGGSYVTIATPHTTHWTDTTALNDTTYYYVVSADNNSGEVLNSLEAAATPRRAVTGLEAVGGIAAVTLSWDAYSGATNYLMQRATISGGPYDTAINLSNNSYLDTNVLNDVTYYYVVNAQTADYVSTPSDQVSAMPAYRTIFYDSFESPVVTGHPETAIPGWYRSATRNGLWNVDSTSMVTPWGSQAAWVWSLFYIQTTNITETLTGGATYKLSVNVASEYALGDIKYKLELLAGTNVLNAVTAAFVVDTMDFALRSETLLFTAPTNSAYIGQPLGLRLSYPSGDWHYVIGFDNVRLATDIPPPPVLPDPLSFAVLPTPLAPSSITMTATAITNGVPPITYYFENTTNGTNSGWIPRTTWTNTALLPEIIYGYRVKARDMYGNEVAWSPVATTSIVDAVPPTPNPAQFAVIPWQSSLGEAMMTATTATDPCGPVAYYFENVTASRNSGWSTRATWTDVGLVTGQTYSFRVKARDNSPAANETAWSGTTNLYVVGAAYTVTFDANGGTAAVPANKQVNVAGTYGALAATSRTNYTFTGWFTAASGGSLVTSATRVTSEADHALYAHWNAFPVVNAGPDQEITMNAPIPWTPAATTTLAWYDASATNTITHSSGSVSEWRDKSGNNNHASQTTAASKPTTGTRTSNGLNVLDFDGTADFLNMTSLLDLKNRQVLFVIQKDAAGANPIFSESGKNTQFTTDTNNLATLRYASATSPYWTTERLSGTTFTATDLVLGGFIGTTNIGFSINGSYTTTNGNAGGTQSSVNMLGKIGSASIYFNGAFAEVVFLSSTASAEREKVEGYLAHKWGLAAKLPEGHPYKSAAPLFSQGMATLDGTISDPEGDTLTTTWSKTSGATVTFTNAALVDTFASFPEVGVYTLCLTANDGFGSAYDECVITVLEWFPRPTALSATALSSSQIQLAWLDNSTNETGFVIERSLMSNTNFAVIGTVGLDATNFTDTTVSPVSTYYYRVLATHGLRSSSSDEAWTTTPKTLATVTLGNLSQAYDGTARSVTATTVPEGLTVDVTYNGSAAAPIRAGLYAVTGVVISATYAGWTNSTLTVTANAVVPALPTGLAAVPSVRQVALSWTASAEATGYHVKRASSSGGPYVTLGSTNGTSYVDTTANNGATYYYVISAFNTGGESADSSAGSAVLPYGLPFAENFEGLSVSNLNTQNGWSAVDTSVQTNTVKAGAQAASITSGTGYLQHTFAGADTNVWTDFVLQPVFFENAPSLSDPVGTVNLYFNTNGHPVVYDGTTATEKTTVTVTTGAWVRVTVRSDYVARKWDLYINDAAVASSLSFYTAAPLVYTSFKVSGAGASSVALDDLLIGLLPPWPSKGTLILFHF